MFGKKAVARLMFSLSLVAALSTLVMAQQKRRIAVLDADYATSTNSQVYALYGSAANLSRDLSDLLVNRLQQLGTYELYDRQKIQAVLNEQNFGASGRVDQATAARIGKLHGIQGLILVSIKRADFTPPTRSKIPRLNKIPILGIGNLPLKNAKATVAITFRLVNTDTAVIALSGDHVGEASEKSTILNPDGVLTENSSNQEVAKFLLRGAIQDVVGKIALQVEQNPSVLPEPIAVRAPEPPKSSPFKNDSQPRGKKTAKVVEIDGTKLFINIGQNQGVQKGDCFDIKQVIKEVPDPDHPGKTLPLSAKIGELVIDEVDEQVASGTYKGTPPINPKSAKVKMGDQAVEAEKKKPPVRKQATKAAHLTGNDSAVKTSSPITQKQ